MKKKLILTYSSGQTELTGYTYPFLERYCEHHGIDLLIIRENNIKIQDKFKTDGANWFVGSDRWFAYDLFSIYDRILWVGSDVLVHPYAPNIFDVVPYGYIGGCVEHEKGQPHHAGDICGDCYNAHGLLPDKYINIDVMLVDRPNKEIFNYEHTDLKLINKGKWQDQDYFNYYIAFNNIPLYDLGYKWNCMFSKYYYTGRPFPEDAYFIHATGMQPDQRIEFIKNYLLHKGMI